MTIKKNRGRPKFNLEHRRINMYLLDADWQLFKKIVREEFNESGSEHIKKYIKKMIAKWGMSDFSPHDIKNK